MIKVHISGNRADVIEREPLTSGTVGKVINFAFTEDWRLLIKYAVFEGSGRRIALTNIGDSCIIPHEVMAKHGGALRVGVYGRTADGSAATPTVYAQLGIIQRGADPNADPSTKPTLPVWAQLQAQIGDLSNLTTEDKTNLVAAINEAAQTSGGGTGDHSKLQNRDAADQHPMSAITGLVSALEGKQPVGEYLTLNNLQSATDAALAQAKASGEFDGAKGDKGDPGSKGDTGAAGAPGIVISSEEPTDPNHPVWIDPKGDETPDNPLGITGATVGQIAKIAAVDASGVPTAWSPVDMPTGVDEEWRKVIDAEVTEPTAEFIADGLNGATELHIAWSALQNASTMNSGLSVKINNIRVGTYQTAALVQKNGSVIYGWTHLKFDGLHWMLCKSAGALTADNITQSTVYTIYNLIANVGAANTIGFGAPSQQYAPITGKLEVWAR